MILNCTYLDSYLLGCRKKETKKCQSVPGRLITQPPPWKQPEVSNLHRLPAFLEDSIASLLQVPSWPLYPWPRNPETYARLLTATRSVHKPAPLSLKASRRAIGPKLSPTPRCCQVASTPRFSFPSIKVKERRRERPGFGGIRADASTWTTCDPRRRRDDSASGRGPSAAKKMAQPGTDAQAMERPVQTARVHAGEHGGCEGTSTSTSPSPSLPGIQSTSVCRSRSGRQGKVFDVSYCCRKWRRGAGPLKE